MLDASRLRIASRILYISLCWSQIVEPAETSSKGSNHPFKVDCGLASSRDSVNYNGGIKLDGTLTLYVFGDSLSSTGNSHGGTAPPAVQKDDKPLYGGRASNGLMWGETILTEAKGKVANFARGGAVIDKTLYKSVKETVSDLPHQVDSYIEKKLQVDPLTSITSVYFGTNDMMAASKDKTAETSLVEAAQKYLDQVKRLIDSGMTQFLTIAPPFNVPMIQKHNNIIWKGMMKLQKDGAIKFARVNIGDLFQQIGEDPKKFGYVDNGNCLKFTNTTNGGCTDPKLHPFWMSGHPSAETQKLVAEFITQVLATCGAP